MVATLSTLNILDSEKELLQSIQTLSDALYEYESFVKTLTNLGFKPFTSNIPIKGDGNFTIVNTLIKADGFPTQFYKESLDSLSEDVLVNSDRIIFFRINKDSTQCSIIKDRMFGILQLNPVWFASHSSIYLRKVA